MGVTSPPVTDRARTIVVVEDEPAIRELLEALLGSAGYRVVSTGDPLDALPIVRREQPDLVLCDISMPGLDGYGVLRALQADPETADRPVVFLTAHREFTSRVEAFRFGVVDYMTKPFTRELLLRRIARVFETLEDRTGQVAETAGPEGARELLDEVGREQRSGLISVEGRGAALVHAGAVVAGAVEAQPGARVEFRELDPTREVVATPEPARLPGSLPELPSFEDVPQHLRSVLLVDDNPTFRNFLKSLFQSQGFEVLEAASGEEAIHVALERRPWLILTDVAMAGMDGLALCREIRAHSLTRHVPLVFLSGWDGYEQRYQGLEAGADEFLSKDTPVRELLIRVRLILKRFSDLGRRERRDRGAGVEGRLEAVGAPGALQMCHLGRMTGRLEVTAGRHTWEIDFAEGEIVGARGPELHGEEAVYGLIGLARGEFEFRPGPAARGGPLGENFAQLLLEGCRRLDETARA